MNVFYEEDGAFKAGFVLADNTTSLQVESTHGKRSKIKAASILVRFQEPLSGFMESAQKVADDIDPDFLWECCPQEEFAFDALSEDYFGHVPSSHESAGVLIRLHHSPMHFYKKGKGKYRAAPPEALKAALAGQEKKRRQAELQAGYVEELKARRLPEAFSNILPELLYDPDKNSLEYKAIQCACEETGLSVPHLLQECGAIPSSHDYHLNRFFFEHFPRGLPVAENCGMPELQELPRGDAKAFSIDDATTTEIDDAFSVSFLQNGNLRIGIHIAAPAIGIAMGSEADRHALGMLSTIYIPGKKFTMLPRDAIEVFTLSEHRICPVLSLYLEIGPDFQVIASRNALESIEIAANLRHETIDSDCRFSKELEILLGFAERLEALRDKPANNQIDYSFQVEDDRVAISERQRGAPLDKTVSELMIHANSEWARQLSEAGYAAIYRSQNNGKVRQDTTPSPHQGLGVSQYAWTTSPLRRYVDLINQRQLVSMIREKPPAYETASDEMLVAMRNFDQAYEAYNGLQRTMERYWCLRWLLQENVSRIHATVQRENWVKFDGLPLTCKVPSLPEMSAGSRVALEAGRIDLIELAVHARFLERI